MRNNQESVWMLQTKRADFNAIAARFHISPVTARIIRNRDVEGEKAIDRYLNGTLDQLYDPHLMKDMDKAAALILEKIRAGVRIRIVGDYDIDGVCSTYLLYRGPDPVRCSRGLPDPGAHPGWLWHQRIYHPQGEGRRDRYHCHLRQRHCGPGAGASGQRAGHDSHCDRSP